MAQKKQTPPKSEIQTIEITNFGGRLTRILNGDMNSGFAKFATSWGYDPFSKPMNLTWFEQPVDITGNVITDLIIASKKYFGASGFSSGDQTANTVQQWVALLGNTGKLYVMQPNQISPQSSIIANVDSVIGVTSISGTFNFGGALEIFVQPSVVNASDTTGKAMYVSSDTKVSTKPMSSLLATQRDIGANLLVGTINNATGAFRPMKIFQGFLRVGNGNTTVTISGNTGTITSLYVASIRGVSGAATDLQTPLPIDCEIQDLDVSIDGNYLLMATSNVDNEQIGTFGQDFTNAATNDSIIYGWNGNDQNITTQTTIPSMSLTALQTYLGTNLFFGQDAFGSSVTQTDYTSNYQKILVLPGNKSPWANATVANGNFLTWVNVEDSQSNNSSFVTLYYFGGLDQENPPGLYRMSRISSFSGFVYSAPVNTLVDNYYRSVPSSVTSGSTVTPVGYGKHYISLMGPGFNGASNINKLYRFLLNSTGSGSPQFGVYETQTQLFSKRITVKQIRVYTQSTVAGNGFQIDFIGSDGNPITNGTKTYTFASGTDITQLQGSLERIDFNPSMRDVYALGVRLTNTGTTNMTIKKVEIDWAYSGK